MGRGTREPAKPEPIARADCGDGGWLNREKIQAMAIA